MATASPRLPAPYRRRAIEPLSLDSLHELTEHFGVKVSGDLLEPAAHMEALVRSPRVDFGELLTRLKRDELQAICEALGLGRGGREKQGLIDRILAGSANDGEIAPAAPAPPEPPATFALTSPEPRAPTKKRTPTKAPRRSAGAAPSVESYRYEETRKNNPPAGLVEFDKPPQQPTKKYRYDPHIDPQLEWAGKAERTSFEVDTVSLHIHERISTEAILRAVRREPAQRSLFGETVLSESKEIDFYAHDVGWSNRMILGDSLLVMNSLLEREHMAGQVQCIYMDPPYGVNFKSNFQPWIARREMKDGDDASLTREPEQIQAYRDTWTLGVHSYLTYMRDRLLLARELLATSGSIFVQISDENVHHVRELMDEVFGSDNFVSMISFKTTGGQTNRLLSGDGDYVLWYSKEKVKIKFRQLYRPRENGDDGAERYVRALSPDGTKSQRLSQEQIDGTEPMPPGWRQYRLTSLTSQRPPGDFVVEFEGEPYKPRNTYWKTNPEGMRRLILASRVEPEGKMLAYRRFLNDFPVVKLTTTWTDTQTNFGGDKLYVVRTAEKVVARCILMTTDPGDLVLDPTCGSGTTAAVAEQWGRRWITCDTSRVAMAIARQRMLVAKFPYYLLRSNKIRDGLVYKTVPHIMLESIAQNARIDQCKNREEIESLIQQSAESVSLYNDPLQDKNRIRVSGPFTVEAIPVASLDLDEQSPIASFESSTNGDATPGERSTMPGTSAGDYIGMMIDLLKKTGVQFPLSKHLGLTKLRPVKGPYEYLHAESELDDPGDSRRVAVSFGPRHAPVTPIQVRDAITEARGYDLVLFVGFACDPEARRIIDAGLHGRELQFVAAAPDILVSDLLKTTKATKLFTVFGSPDVKVHREKESGTISVELTGIDLYDPNTGETHDGKGADVAAWFVDQDYDGKTFCVSQALFPAQSPKNPWEKLQRALKGTIDEETFEALRGTRSLPFKPGKRVAVTVIDDRGNEVIKIVDPRGEGDA
jgi:adenine-specific DNA-methyltransferase